MTVMQKSYNELEKSCFVEALPLLTERLEFIKLQPTAVLLITPYADSLASELKSRYKNAVVETLTQHIAEFPLKKQHFDMIVAPALSPRYLLADEHRTGELTSQYELLFYLIYHLLSEQGLFLFSALGPETTCLGDRDDILGMPYLGDMLLKTGFVDPVMDRDRFPELELEWVFGQAWGSKISELSKPNKDGTVYVSVDQIKHL